MADVVTPRARTIILTDASTVAYSDALAGYDGTVGTPSPTPAPSFTELPSIEGILEVGQTLAAMDGTILYATEVSRRWLLGSVLKSTAATWLASSAGELVLEVTATGPGGSTTVSSAPVQVVVADTGTPTPTGPVKQLGVVGWNVNHEQLDSVGVSALINRGKASGQWRTATYNDNLYPVPVNANGYPTGMPNDGREAIILEANYDGPTAPGHAQRYVIETDLPLSQSIRFLHGANIVNTNAGNGVRRIEYDVTQTTEKGWAYSDLIFLDAGWPAFSKWDMFRLDQEAAFRAGEVFQPQALSRAAAVSGQRLMGWDRTNERADFTNYPTLAAQNYSTAPIDIMVEWCNRTDQPMWLNIPHAATDAQVRAVVRYVFDRLAPHLALYIEYTNEGWNFQFAQTTYLYNLRDPGPGAENINYGYRAAQIMAIVHDELDHSPRVFGILATQNTSSAVTERVITGVNEAISEWATTGSMKANADYAARYPAIGALFPILAPAGYMAAGADAFDANIAPADKATLEGWADATDDSGLAAYFNLLRTGVGLTKNEGNYLNNWPTAYAGQKAIAEREGMRLVMYEFCICLQQWASEKINGLQQRAARDPRMLTLYRDTLNTLLGPMGYDNVIALSDVGQVGGQFAHMEGINDVNAPRYQGVAQTMLNPPAAPTLSVEITGSGTSYVGAAPVNKIVVRGGRGVPKVTIAGLAPGRSVSFRNIVGAYTQATSQPQALTVTVVDDVTGQTATATLVQEIAASAPSLALRYLRVDLLSNVQYGGIGVDAITVIDTMGVEHQAVSWVNDADTGANMIAPNDGASYYTDAPPPARKAQADFGSVLNITAIVVYRMDNINNAPQSAEFFGSTTPFPSYGTGGTSILAYDDGNRTAWEAAGLRRVFELAV